MGVGELITAFLLGLGGASGIWTFMSDRRVRKAKKDILRGMLLDPRWEWRNFETLQRVIRESPDTTRDLLIEIGARASVKEENVWILEG